MNLLAHKTTFTTDKIWNAVKDIKVQNLGKSRRDCRRRSNSDDHYDSGAALCSVEDVEKKLQIKLPQQRIENISIDHFKTATEMLVYLMTETEDRSWLQFYWNLFQTQTATQIILTLNRIMKNDEEGKNLPQINKLFKRVASIFGLKYEQIKIMMPENAKKTINLLRNMQNLSADGIGSKGVSKDYLLTPNIIMVSFNIHFYFQI